MERKDLSNYSKIHSFALTFSENKSLICVIFKTYFRSFGLFHHEDKDE